MKTLAILLSVAIMLSSITTFTSEDAVAVTLPPLPMPQADWTIMCYMDGDNDLEIPLLGDINEMEMVGSTAHVRIVAQLDRWNGFEDGYYQSGKDDTTNGDWKGAKRFYITQDSDGEIIDSSSWDIGEVNMGDPNVLESFIRWAKLNFPANNYCLVLGDHGHAVLPGGVGVCWDWTSDPNKNERLTPYELSTIDYGVFDSDIDILLFDACQLAYTEILYELQFCDINYIVGSEEVIHGDGFPYHDDVYPADIIGNFVNYYWMGASYFASDIVQQFAYKYQSIYPISTAAAISTSSIPTLISELDNFANSLIAADSVYANHIAIETAIDTCQEFFWTIVYGRDLYDFAHLVYDGRGNTIPSAIVNDPNVQQYSQSLMQAIAAAQLASWHGWNAPNAHGIGICLPESCETFILNHDTYYLDYQLSRDAKWDDFITQFYCGGDNSPPVITVNQNRYPVSGYYNTDPGAVIDVDFTLSGATYTNSPLDYAQYQIGANWYDIFTDIYGYTANWAVSWSALSEGANSINIRCYDMAGNVATVNGAITIYKDTTGPAPQSIPTEGSPDKDWGNGAYTVYWPEAVDLYTLVAQYEIQENVNNGATWQSIGYSSTNNYPVTGRNIDGNFYRYRIRAQDTLGNWDGWSGVSDGITTDLTPPNTPAAPAAANIYDDGVTRWSDATVTWVFVTTDDGSGIDQYNVQVRRDSSDGATVADAWTASTAYTFTGANGVTYFVRARATDKIGNLGAWGEFSSGITVDAAAPVNSGIETTDIFSLMPVLEVYAEDSRSGMGHMRFANKGDVWWPVEQAIETPHWNNNGYVFQQVITEPQASSLMLHFSEIYLREIGTGGTFIGDDGTIMGVTPPTIPDSLEIFDGGGIMVASYYGVGAIYDVSVTVPGSSARIVYSCPDGTDDLSGTSWGFKMENYEWLDLIQWSAWIPYNTAYQWQLAPDPNGLYKVYFQVKDQVGNEALPVSKLLYYLGWDEIPPEINVKINNGAKYVFGPGGNPPRVSVSVVSMDNLGGSGVMSYRSSRDGNLWTDWNDWPTIGSGPGRAAPVSTVDPNLLSVPERGIWDYFVNGYYPFGSKLAGNSITPSRSLMDAALEDENLYYFPTLPRLQIFDQKGGIFKGDVMEYRTYVDDVSHPLKITLAWQDELTPVLDNLNLQVTTPDWKKYLGNNLVNGWSVSTQLSNMIDNTNSIEIIWIQNPVIGEYKIEVLCPELQVSCAEPYAVMISGGLEVGYATVLLDRIGYDDSDVVNIRIEDTNCPADKLSVTLTSYDGEHVYDQETVQVFVTQHFGGIFLGSINAEYETTAINSDSVLQVKHGMVIVCRYNDASPARTAFTNAFIDITLAPAGEIVLDNLGMTKGWGTKTCYVQVRDRVGNIATASDTIEFASSDWNIPLQVLTYQEVNITLTIEGREWNIVELILLEDERYIQSMAVTRFSNDKLSNSQTMTARIYTEHTSIDGNTTSVTRHYSIELRYLSRLPGANPFIVKMSSGDSMGTIKGTFIHVQKIDMIRYNLLTSDSQHYLGTAAGNTAAISINSNDLISSALGGNVEFHFLTQSRSTCVWNFGDGAVMEGDFVSHVYADSGTYTVTLTYLDDEMEVIRQMNFDVVVFGGG